MVNDIFIHLFTLLACITFISQISYYGKFTELHKLISITLCLVNQMKSSCVKDIFWKLRWIRLTRIEENTSRKFSICDRVENWYGLVHVEVLTLSLAFLKHVLNHREGLQACVKFLDITYFINSWEVMIMQHILKIYFWTVIMYYFKTYFSS